MVALLGLTIQNYALSKIKIWAYYFENKIYSYTDFKINTFSISFALNKNILGWFNIVYKLSVNFFFIKNILLFIKSILNLIS